MIKPAYSYTECWCTGSGCVLWTKQKFCHDCSWSDGAGTICAAQYPAGGGCSYNC